MIKSTIIWAIRAVSTLVIALLLTRLFISTGVVGKFFSTETGRNFYGNLLLYTGVGGGEDGMDLVVMLLVCLALIPAAAIVWIVPKIRF